MDVSAEDTMPDDAWKDSFDKLLDQRPKLHVIKRDVRASFNMNSSYENSGYDNSKTSKLNSETKRKDEFMNISTSPAAVNVHYLDIPKNVNAAKLIKQRIKPKIVSTPIKTHNSCNPFKCTLSPIGPWDLHHFNCNNKTKNTPRNGKLVFNATPVNNDVVVNVENLNGSSVEKETTIPRHSLGISPFQLVRNKWKTKQTQKQFRFASPNLLEKLEKYVEDINGAAIESMCPPLPVTVTLQAGKWRKSLNCLRRFNNSAKDDADMKQYDKGRHTDIAKRAMSVAGERKSIYIRPNSSQPRRDSRSTYSLGNNDFKRQILRRCGQRRILTFSNAYSEDYLKNCCKIGEGAFGEVFVYSKPKELRGESKNDEKTVLKIIPIEGKDLVNGEVQKTFEQILPEIIISMELCGLQNHQNKNATSGFVNLQGVKCVKGQYPLYLQKLWEEYDLEKESENEHPKCFTNNQQYIVLELSYGGKDMEGFEFKNAEQSFYALQQIMLTLAVGEKEYQFEHRDLHWGNVLVQHTNQKYISYKLDDQILTIPTKGIQITIIDYTLSRITFNDYCFYNDLSNDEELFTAEGDYQFEIYRMMRKVVNNKWEIFEPKTNIFWISYIISKLIDGVNYKSIRSRCHLHYLEKLKQLQASLFTYTSCMDYVQNGF